MCSRLSFSATNISRLKLSHTYLGLFYVVSFISNVDDHLHEFVELNFVYIVLITLRVPTSTESFALQKLLQFWTRSGPFSNV